MTSTPKSARPAAPRGRRRRRWGRILLTLLVLAVALRAFLPLSLPGLLDDAVAPHGLRCDYERLEFSLLDADVELWHLEVGSRDGGDPMLHVEYVRADISVLEELSGRFRLTDVTGVSRVGERALAPVVTVKDGRTYAPGTGPHAWGFAPPAAIG